MRIEEYYCAEEEKPLDRIVSDGGFCGIFRTIGCIGDSLSSGEYELTYENGDRYYPDMYEYSWGQYLARMAGNKVYNFSRSGMTAKEYMETFAEENGFWNEDKKAQAYILALGVNDLAMLDSVEIKKRKVGTVQDLDLEDYTRNNPDTFAGWYGKIIQKVRELSPDSILFFMTMPREESDSEDVTEKKQQHAKLLYDLTEVFQNSYVIDLYQYAPVYDQKFKDHFFYYGHMNPAGYLLTGKMVASYIDWIIRRNPIGFDRAGLIGKDIEPGVPPKKNISMRKIK